MWMEQLISSWVIICIAAELCLMVLTEENWCLPGLPLASPLEYTFFFALCFGHGRAFLASSFNSSVLIDHDYWVQVNMRFWIRNCLIVTGRLEFMVKILFPALGIGSAYIADFPASLILVLLWKSIACLSVRYFLCRYVYFVEFVHVI